MVKHDDYMTPYTAWSDICEYLPKDRKVWEAFRGVVDVAGVFWLPVAIRDLLALLLR